MAGLNVDLCTFRVMCRVTFRRYMYVGRAAPGTAKCRLVFRVTFRVISRVTFRGTCRVTCRVTCSYGGKTSTCSIPK